MVTPSWVGRGTAQPSVCWRYRQLASRCPSPRPCVHDHWGHEQPGNSVWRRTRAQLALVVFGFESWDKRLCVLLGSQHCTPSWTTQQTCRPGPGAKSEVQAWTALFLSRTLSRVLTWSSFLTGLQSLRWGPSLVASFDSGYLLRPISVQPQGGWVDIRPVGRREGRVIPGTRQAQAEPAWASCSPPRGPHSHSVHLPGQGQLSERHTPAIWELARCRQQATDHGGHVCEVHSL